MNDPIQTPAPAATEPADRFLFIACFVSLVATSFAFMIRVMAMEQWQIAFGLTETQKGQIYGAGLWPFGISIVLFSLVIDRLGYGKSMIFAFLCHIASTVLLVLSKGYWGLYIGSVLNGLAAGTVEAVINPAVATMYPKSKTKMLTILHAGWPGGMVLGGLMILGLQGLDITAWQVKVAVILLPVLTYGVMLLYCRFPVSERVAAGVSYRDMLKEAGAVGCLIVAYMIFMVLNDVILQLFGVTAEVMKPVAVGAGFNIPCWPLTVVWALTVAAYLAYTRSAGRPLYILLLIVMIFLAITELGTDTWIKDLMKPAMARFGLNTLGREIDAGWVLVYTAFIMMVLRFCIGPIVKILQPLGVLLASALLAAVGLYFLSSSEGVMLLVMATIYGAGQCFFWPATLGVVSEQFPRGGALTLNAIAGVGMMGVGILGSILLGYWQDTRIDENLRLKPELHARVMQKQERTSIFGQYRGLDQGKVNEISDKAALHEFRVRAAEKITPPPSAAELTAKLAGDRKYQMLVRNAYTHMVSRTVKPFAEMHAALDAKGVFVDEVAFVAVKKDRRGIASAQTDAKQHAMANVATLPLIMAVCYFGMILYFAAKGGYTAVEITRDGRIGGEHYVDPQEAVDDDEATPSE